jgi:3-phytase
MRIFKMSTRCLVAAFISLAAGTACAAAPTLVLKPWASTLSVEAAGFLPAGLGDARLAATASSGLLLLDAQGAELARLAGAYASLDSRAAGQNVLVASVDTTRQQTMVVSLDLSKRTWGQPLYLPTRDFPVNGVCLYRDDASNLFVFLVGEEGKGEQWWVGQGATLGSEARRVRSVPLPPSASFCQVDDASGRLLVNERNVGWWAYPAHPEAAAKRVPLALRQPFGDVSGAAGAIAAVPGGVLALDPEAKRLHGYQQTAGGWSAQFNVPVAGLQEPQGLAIRTSAKGTEVLLRDDGDGHLYQGELAWRATSMPPATLIPSIAAQAQTDPVARQGDAADDPAIWVHPQTPSLSRVLGTNKKQGLLVYDLNGQLLQALDVGRLNNVDVRYGVKLGDKTVDLAVATNRDRNSLSLFSIDRQSGELSEAGEVATPLKNIYGLCLFQPASGEIYAIANDKDGTFVQYRLGTAGGGLAGSLVRRFKLDSQPEGCVADDERHRLFIGEEDVGVWAVDARADQPAQLTSVIKVGGALHADVEGLALYQSAAQDYLLVSSQGNDSYLVLDTAPPFAVRGAFGVGINAALGIDGASETDGLEVTSMNLGGVWSAGLLVVQDGHKRMPEQAQNFKYVPWDEIAKALKLP